MVRKGCVIGTLVIFVISMVVLAVPLAFLAAISAPLHTPQLIAHLICPAESRVEVTWHQEIWNAPGERTASVECVDAAGNRSPAAELDEKVFPAALLIYYPICLVPLLLGGSVFGLALYFLIRRLRRKDEKALEYH